MARFIRLILNDVNLGKVSYSKQASLNFFLYVFVAHYYSLTIEVI